MSISEKTKRRLEKAVTSKDAAAELVAAMDSMGSGPAAVVTAIGTTANIPAAACEGGAEPTATQVNAAIDTVAAAAEARLDVIEGKIDAVLAALKASGQMATS
jgi:hypothetical protein